MWVTLVVGIGSGLRGLIGVQGDVPTVPAPPVMPYQVPDPRYGPAPDGTLYEPRSGKVFRPGVVILPGGSGEPIVVRPDGSIQH
jgi:hypothetical protein